MKFINLSGKRLLTHQWLIIAGDMKIKNILEPTDEIKELIECRDQLPKHTYNGKAEKIIELFDIEDGDYVHINGIDLNLVLAIHNNNPKINLIYSKMEKKKEDEKYVTNFICFVNLLY